MMIQGEFGVPWSILEPSSPSRWTLSTSMFFGKDTDHAVATATDALNAASAGIEDIPEESRNDTGQQGWSLERQEECDHR